MESDSESSIKSTMGEAEPEPPWSLVSLSLFLVRETLASSLTLGGALEV